MTIQTAQLLRLASPALPIGGFAWSSGLEGAIDAGIVRDPTTAAAWLEDALRVQARWDAAIVWRLLNTNDRSFWSELYLAARETRELRQETLSTGTALMTLLAALRDPPMPAPPLPLPHAWAIAAETWQIPAEPALDAWLVAFVENQLAVLQKAVPLGQVAVQRLFDQLLPALARASTIARTITDDDLSSSTPGLAILSSRHEHQYSRLFRS